MAALLAFISVPPGHKFRDAHSRLFAGVRTRVAARRCDRRPAKRNLFGVCPEIHLADKAPRVAKELDYLIAFHARRHPNRTPRGARGARPCAKLGGTSDGRFDSL